MLINTYDIDGVIFFGKEFCGVRPEPHDIIITGRSVEERAETQKMLDSRGIKNVVFYNPISFVDKTRVMSGIHKGRIISELKKMGVQHGFHFEDDEIQIEQILKIDPTIRIVHLVHNYTEK